MAGKLYQDKDWLYEQYWVHGKGASEIAEVAGCGRTTITRWMQRLGIPGRTRTEANRLKAQDPAWQKANAEGARRRAQDPAWQKAHAEAARRRAQDPAWRKAQAEGARRKAQDPVWRKAKAEAIRRLVQDPAWQKANAEGARRRAQDPAWQKAQAARNRRLAQDPAWRKAHAEGIDRRAQDPAWQKATAEANRRKAQDPVWQKAVTEANRRTSRRLALKKRNQGQMTSIEAICFAAFESLGLEFVFEKFIYPYRVDFFFPSHGVIVEAMGKYWHEKPRHRKRDPERKQFLEACGYTVLEWWGPDIKADVWKLIDGELLPLLDQPSRMERPPRGVSKPYRGPHGWKSAIQLYLFGKELDD